jgi:chorismate mutase
VIRPCRKGHTTKRPLRRIPTMERRAGQRALGSTAMSEGSAAGDGTADDKEMEPAVAAELLRLRGSIDNMDAALIHLLAERFKITQQVGHLKAEYGLPPADPAREAQQIERLRSLAVEAKLDPEFAEKFLTFVVAEVVRHHETLQASRG